MHNTNSKSGWKYETDLDGHWRVIFALWLWQKYAYTFQKTLKV